MKTINKSDLKAVKAVKAVKAKAIKERIIERQKTRLKNIQIYNLRVKWEKARHYGLYNESKKIWRELLDMGFYVSSNYKPISIYND